MVNRANVSVASGDNLDVRGFQVTQAMSRLFRIELSAVSSNPDIDFDQIIGKAASFSLSTVSASQSWTGIVVEMDQIRVEAGDLATYTIVISPMAYLLTERKNYRIFQFKSEIDIVSQMLDEWGVQHRVKVDKASHPPRKFRVQYGESDFNFISRMLEDAGISYYFEEGDDGTVMVLDDEPQTQDVAYPNLQFYDTPEVAKTQFVTRVAVAQRTRPGKNTIGDLDYRKGSTSQPRLSNGGGLGQEAQLEQFDYEPGAFLYQTSGGGNTPTADDRGASRTDEGTGAKKTKNRLLGRRQDAMRVGLESNVLSLKPGTILSVSGHPHAAVAPEAPLLVTSASIEGDQDDDWRVELESVGIDTPFRPEQVTHRPKVRGLESATAVGPGSEEIHTDEYGRTRVHFHWDRESKRDEKSSCWLPVNQPWAGASFGGISLVRIGQEVLVDFLGGDPDRPQVVGRVFTKPNPPNYPMPEGMKITGIIGKTSPALVMGAADAMGTDAFTDMFARDTSFGPFKAQPPKPMSPYMDDNAFVMGDAQGEDITFLQAKKDMNWVIKNKWSTVVGNMRACFVGHDDRLTVRNKQKIEIGENQVLRINKNQDVFVGEVREEKVDKKLILSVLEDATVYTEGTIEYKAPKAILCEATEMLQFKVGDSTITINGPSIVLQSAKVELNPES
jgi:type VI secretion system secreted protein VgrG